MGEENPVIRLKNMAIGDFARKYSEGDMPIVNIWLTGSCYLNCRYCATSAGRPDIGELGPSEWKGVIRECRDLGAQTVSINGKGEPLLDSGFRKTVSFARESNMGVIVSTNGIALAGRKGRRLAQFLYGADVNIVMKMPAFDPQVYDALAGVEGAYQQAWGGLDNLMGAGYPDSFTISGDETLSKLSLEVLLMKPAMGSIPEVFRFCRENKIYPMVDGIVATGRVLENRDLEDLELSGAEEAELWREFADIFGHPYEGEPNYSCPIRMGMFIDNQGYVRADSRGNSCDVPYRNKVGNVRETPVAELWENLLRLRKESGNKVEPVECGLQDPGRFPRCYRMLETREEYFRGG